MLPLEVNFSERGDSFMLLHPTRVLDHPQFACLAPDSLALQTDSFLVLAHMLSIYRGQDLHTAEGTLERDRQINDSILDQVPPIDLIEASQSDR